MRLKSLTTLPLVLSALISSCGHVLIHDDEWCADAGDSGASCFHTLSDKQRSLSKQEWDLERFGSVCGRPEAFGHMKTAILQLCNESKRCKYEEVKKIVDAFSARLDFATMGGVVR